MNNTFKRTIIIFFVALVFLYSASCATDTKINSSISQTSSFISSESISDSDVDSDEKSETSSDTSNDASVYDSAVKSSNTSDSKSGSNSIYSTGSITNSIISQSNSGSDNPVNNSVRPRRVNSTNPMFNFKGTSWNLVPDEIKRFSAMSIDCSKIENVDIEAYAEENVGIVIQMENWISHAKEPVISLAALEQLFKENKNIIGVSFVEQSCSYPNINATQIKRIIDTIKLCGKYQALFVWEDMGYADRINVFAFAGQDSEIYKAIKDNKDYVVFVNKMNGSGQYFHTQSLLMGYWTSGLSTAWGINCEDFWWAEAGYGKSFTDSGGIQANCRNSLGGYDLMLATRARYCIPDALVGQMVGLAMSQGACWFSFENGERTIHYDNQLVPLFSKVIMPLHRLAAFSNAIPTRQQVISRIKVAYHEDDSEASIIKFPSENLFRDLYGSNQHSEEWIKTNRVSPEFMPSTGRYYNLPVIAKLAKADAQKVFSTILDSKTMPADKKTFFNSKYAQNATGTSCIMSAGAMNFITNPYESTNSDTNFGNLKVNNGKYTLDGTLNPYSYIYTLDMNNGLKLHLNNYIIDTDTAIWNNTSFSTHGFLREYVKPDCIWAKNLRTTKIIIKGFTKNARILASGANVSKTWSNNTLTLNISHNGPVDITITE